MNDGQNEKSNQRLFLKRVPDGLAGPDDFEVREETLPQLEEGELWSNPILSGLMRL